MSAPALVNQWYTRGNIPFPNVSSAANINKSLLFLLKHILKGDVSTGTVGPEGARPTGSYWTCVGSSDSVTAALDGTDRWTTTYDASKLVQAANGNAHSWIVLQSPAAAGPIYLCIDLNSATTTSAGFIFSRAVFSGGSTTTRPTSTAEFAINLNSAPAATTTITFNADNTLSSTFYASFSCLASGEWCIAFHRTTTGIFFNTMGCVNNVDTKLSETHPTWIWMSQATTGRGAGNFPGSGGLATATGFTSRTFNGGGFSTAGGVSTWVFGATSMPSNMAADQQDSNFVALPLYFCHTTATVQSWRGRMPDIWCTGTATVGASYPTAANPTQHVVGDLILPMSVVPIL